MAEGLAAGVANSNLDSILASYPWIKLHTGAPGAAGTANAATETTRKQATWAAASGGASTTTNELSWTNVAGSEDYTHYSAWSASSAGMFGHSGTITANAVTAGDTFTIPVGGLDVAFTIAS
jgi:hypothetical protein